MIISWQVHGGTTATDIVKKVQKAERIATRNKQKDNVDTVLFFDEANTTEAIGLIKEIMCDGRAHGKHISMANGALKIVAACNPYRRYTLFQFELKSDIILLICCIHLSSVTFICAENKGLYIYFLYSAFTSTKNFGRFTTYSKTIEMRAIFKY